MVHFGVRGGHLVVPLSEWGRTNICQCFVVKFKGELTEDRKLTAIFYAVAIHLLNTRWGWTKWELECYGASTKLHLMKTGKLRQWTLFETDHTLLTLYVIIEIQWTPKAWNNRDIFSLVELFGKNFDRSSLSKNCYFYDKGGLYLFARVNLRKILQLTF